MKILIFTEGMIIMHSSGDKIEDYGSYIPAGDAVSKVANWHDNGNEIAYTTSRRTPEEIKTINEVLKRYNFPEGELFYRKGGEEYKDVVARVAPDILIEDDCASIGKDEVICPHLDPKLGINCIVVPEFGGIDHLPNNIDSHSI